MVNANTCRVTGGSAAWINLISSASLGKAPTAKCTRQRTRTQVTERSFHCSVCRASVSFELIECVLCLSDRRASGSKESALGQ